jgi:hypothetical protein
VAAVFAGHLYAHRIAVLQDGSIEARAVLVLAGRGPDARAERFDFARQIIRRHVGKRRGENRPVLPRALLPIDGGHARRANQRNHRSWGRVELVRRPMLRRAWLT